MEETDRQDLQMEIVVGALLRTGVLVSACVVLAGGIVYLIRHGKALPDYHTFHGEPEHLRSIKDIVLMAVSLRGRNIIQLGALLLIATPVARVAFSVYGFAREGDRKYVVITLVVLGLLIYSLFGT
jgi:uncharacterized membrane protein